MNAGESQGWDINICSLSLVLSIKIRRTGHERRHRAVLTAGTPIFTRTGCTLGVPSTVELNMIHPALPKSLISLTSEYRDE